MARKYSPILDSVHESAQALHRAGVMDGVTKSTVAHWEQGAKTPRGPALRLLNLADRKGLDALI